MSNSIQFRRSTAILALVAASIGGGLIAAFAVMSSNNRPIAVTADAQTNKNTAQSSNRVGQLSDSFADVIQKASPSVVEIFSTEVVKPKQQEQNNPFMSDPFFRQFFGGQFAQPRTERKEGLGSGVIIRSDGYIVTNDHVVRHATSLKVTLPDGRQFPAKTVGTDPQTDLAVVKIDGSNLPVLPFGNSTDARVGDIVFAIGNPFGKENTVTMGIVSAKNRSLNLGSGHISNFIQTDAAINPGNSGGALINAHGQMVGMNTMILTSGASFGGEGGNIGIGFAIPSNMVKTVMDQLIKNGKVSRGYIGVSLQQMDPALAKQFGVSSTHGALVAQVVPGKPGAKAGLKPGDVIVAIDGQKVHGVTDTTLKVISHAPGSTITLDVVRDGKHMKVPVTLATRSNAANFGEPNAQNNNGNGGQGGKENGSALDGITAETLTPEIADRLNLPADVHGVIIDSVDQAAPAAGQGVNRGMVITQVNRHDVKDVQDFQRLMNEAKGKPVLLTIYTHGQTLFTVIQPYNK
ncbi:MAG TPA: Do family serine endopeptidase [Bryobacteraceae bacterium]